MKILLITDSYPPEIRSASHLMQELAKGLKDKGHDIIVCTSYPQYNLSEEYKNIEYPEYTKEDDIEIIRVKTLPHHKVNFIIRGIAQVFMPYIYYKKIKKYIKEKINAVIVYTPPLPLAKVGELIKKEFSARYLLNVQDIFPQNAIDLGILKNKLMIKFFEQMEYKAYKNADIITVHSEGNYDFILNRYPNFKDKLSVLHNWVEIKSFEDVYSTGEFRKRYGLENRFIILFAGVIGPSQGLDFVIEVAENIKELKDICFLIVGDGMEKERLERIVKEKQLHNVHFKPFVSKTEYPKLVADCDVGLVSLTSLNKTPVVPGKILGYMASRKPIIAFLNRESDGHKIIENANCGYSCTSDNLQKAVEVTKLIYSKKEELKKMGENGYQYVKDNFDRDLILNKIVYFVGIN